MCDVIMLTIKYLPSDGRGGEIALKSKVRGCQSMEFGKWHYEADLIVPTYVCIYIYPAECYG